MGQFLGFSDTHSLLVANVRHLSTGHISPQFHLVFDDLFETVFHEGDNDVVIDAICNDLFEFNRDWYAEEEYDEDKLVYRPPPLDDVWLDEQGRRNRKQELDYQRRRREDRIREHNRAVPDIIPLNVKDDAGPPTGTHVSYNESSIDSLLEHPTTESEGDFDSPNDILQPSPSSPTLPWNASPEGDTSPEGAKSKRTRKQWPEAVWERGSDGKMKRVELSKHNRDLYHLMFGPQTVPPMAQKMSKKKKRLNYKQYKRSL